MSERLLGAAWDENNHPRLEFLGGGQLLFSMKNPEGGHAERLISTAAAREAFTGVPVDSGWLKPEIVRWGTGRGGDWVVAFMPPRVYEIEMTRETATDSEWKLETDVDRVSVPLPGLIVFGASNQYYIWAVKTEQLDPYHEIYRCPLPNVEASGLICWGPFKPPRATVKTIFEAFDLFMTATHNNHRCNGKSKSQRDDVRVLLRELSGRCAVGSGQPEAPEVITHHSSLITFPVQDLMRQVDHVGITLDQQIRQMLAGGSSQEAAIAEE